jgi:hypothetical protein
MAKTTTAALTAAINTLIGHDVGSPDPIKITEEVHDSATYSRWFCTGSPSKVAAAGEIMGERAMWCKTTVSGNAAAQAAEILVALESSDPSGTVTTDANVDPDAMV